MERRIPTLTPTPAPRSTRSTSPLLPAAILGLVLALGGCDRAGEPETEALGPVEAVAEEPAAPEHPPAADPADRDTGAEFRDGFESGDTGSWREGSGTGDEDD